MDVQKEIRRSQKDHSIPVGVCDLNGMMRNTGMATTATLLNVNRHSSSQDFQRHFRCELFAIEILNRSVIENKRRSYEFDRYFHSRK